MSKFVSIRTSIKDVQCLREALDEMQLRVLDQDSVRGWMGRRKVEFAVRAAGYGEVGFRRNKEGAYEVVGDEMAIPQDFVRSVTQHYAKRKVLKEARKAGFNLVEQEVQQDQAIRLVVRKW